MKQLILKEVIIYIKKKIHWQLYETNAAINELCFGTNDTIIEHLRRIDLIQTESNCAFRIDKYKDIY